MILNIRFRRLSLPGVICSLESTRRLDWPTLCLTAAYEARQPAGKLKAEGVRPAVPDWKLPVPNLDYTGLAIEFKAPGKYPPPDQREYHELLRACFWRVEVSRDPEHAWGIVEDYMSRMDAECLNNIVRVLGEGDRA